MIAVNLTNSIHRFCHFLKLLGADVGAKREPKVEQIPAPFQVRVCHRLPGFVDESKRSTNGGFPDPSCRCGRDAHHCQRASKGGVGGE